MAFNEMDCTNQVAAQERGIAGVRNSYGFAQNPDVLAPASLPAVLHYVPSFNSEIRANFNQWKNSITLRSILCVAPREGQGGRLKFLENSAMPFAGLWRAQFQNQTVIQTLLTNTAAVKAFLVSGQYGAGGELLTIAETSFIGWIFQYEFISA